MIVWTPWKNTKKKVSNENTFDWRPSQHLEGPTLTVTQLRFSHSGEFLLAVCRDRTFHLYRRDSNDLNLMVQCSSLVKNTSPHARIIWTADWSHDDQIFATGSRDLKVRWFQQILLLFNICFFLNQIMLWDRQEVIASGMDQQPSPAFTVGPLKSAITALSFAPCGSNSNYLFAAGLESGEIVLFKVSKSEGKWGAVEVEKFNTDICPAKSISKLTFQPKNDSNYDKLILACSSTDWSVRLFEVAVPSICC